MEQTETKKCILLKLDENLRNKLKGKAALENQTMNDKLVELIENYVKK